ncbi:MAG: hypothetical protein DMG90_21710, partial [Acidobacteria bacterium]
MQRMGKLVDDLRSIFTFCLFTFALRRSRAVSFVDALFDLCYAHPHSSTASISSGGVIVIVPLNEYDFLKRALVAHGTKEAIVCGDVRLTYEAMGERVRRWANAMRALGVAKGDRVAMLSQN